MTSIERPHLKYPVTRGSYVEQGTPEHDESRCMMVVSCPVGFRLERPEFGWPFPTFSTAPIPVDALLDALRTFAGVDIESAAEYADAANAAVRHMTVAIGEEPTSE